MTEEAGSGNQNFPNRLADLQAECTSGKQISDQCPMST